MARVVKVNMNEAAQGSTPMVYAFRTTVREVTSTTLGHAPVDANTPVAKLIMGSRRPKPRRASKLSTVVGYESSFIDVSKIADARRNGWDVTKPRPFGAHRKTPRSQTVYVTINGFKYGWVMRATLRDALGTNLDQLGIKLSEPTDDDLVIGANFPKPPVVKVLLASTTGQGSQTSVDRSTHTTFCDPSKVDNLPEWAILLKPGAYTQYDLPIGG